jgi:hypothetical protein
VRGPGTEDLLGGDAGGRWLADTVKTGDLLTIA